MNRLLCPLAARALFAGSHSAVAQDDWVEQSNAHAQIVLESVARFSPETAGSIGVDGVTAHYSQWKYNDQTDDIPMEEITTCDP